MNRTFVIGDIHGALKALTDLFDKMDLKKGDRLVFLGDYVDGWSQSAETIDYLMEMDKRYDCVFIKGNHDTWCEEWLNGELPNEVWVRNGGRATIESYNNVATGSRKLHLDFLNRMKNYYIDDKNRLFIHAGFSSMHGPQNERYESNYSWDRTLWEMALAMDKRIKKDSKLYPKRLLLFREIYIGHTPTTNYDVEVPMQGCNVWNVDTGAAFRGKISAMDIDSKSFYQSEPCYKLYPNEQGRNRLN